MESRKPHNYLRSYRKRSGLTQREAAFLMGRGDRALLARLELRQRTPPFETALASESVFGLPVSELYAGAKAAATAKAVSRMELLRERLSRPPRNKREERLNAHKLQWLETRLASLSANPNSYAQ